ncbi:preprotein translocase subunit YajC [Kribbella sp. NPDC051718]|uniref:preprotein translocase subunit YajC n=1 Tax=Kribbella sp. NPDC051718 TaxID=3155168 RepID=UPI003446D056
MVLIAAPMASSGGGGITLLLPLILIVGMIWFMSRTQRKQKARQAETVAALQPGTKVITTSGQVGIVEEVDDEYVTLEISDGVLVQFVKAAIGRVLPEETEDVAADEPADEAAEETATEQADVKESVEVPDAGADKVQDKPKLPPTHTEN